MTAAFIAFDDTYFYWSHRALHTKALYRRSPSCTIAAWT
jgi:sterol desaturase/sphingolipid hydroxylase (fatty acid hydroxylase superfamily)